jgi:glycosyltransferase involved in cell wall biosynthesis
VRIAVDARPLAHPHTGIGRYTESLLKRLVESGHQWFLYSDRAITPRFPTDDRVQIRTGNTRPGSPLSLFYSQLVFPRWARGDCVDLFWSPRHHLPLRLPMSVKGVVTVHDLVWKRFPETMQGKNKWLERGLMGPSLRKAAGIIAVSNFTASEVADVYPDCAGRCVTIPEAAETQVRHYEEDFPLPEQAYLLFVGTPEPRKNLPRLLQAYAEARQRGVQQSLVLVGAGGWGNFDLEAVLRELDLQQAVHSRGQVSDAELNALYAGATALLMPSLYEGFGLPALEAMNHGTPVIASNRSALPEVVRDGGLLVNPESVEELSTAITLLCSDEVLHGKLAQQARWQASGFSWDRSAEMTLEALEEIYHDDTV